MPDVTVRTRIVKAERLPNTPSGNPRWLISATDTLPMETDPDGQIGHTQFDRWVGKNASLTVNPRDRIVSARLLDGAAPECGCCNGSGMHYYRAHPAGFSPDDEDIECSACSGRGESRYETRRNGCSGYRTLMRSHR